MSPAQNEPPDDLDRRLEALLRAPTPSVDDAGFPARVLTALPPPRRAVARWSRTTLCTLAALAGTLAAVAAISLGGDPQATWAPLFDTFATVKSSFNDLNVWGALGVALGSVMYALQLLPKKLRS
jgi:hypothetical protein